MRYLVTGGAGFIGSHIVERLLADGHDVRVIDDFSTGREENIAEFAGRIELMRASITDAKAVSSALDGVDGVFHQAAIPSVPRSIAQPLQTHASIVNGTMIILEALRARGKGKLVLASSSSVYGDTEVLPKHEDLRPAPLSPYAAAKLAAEHYTQVWTRLYGIKAVALRYFNIFGPRQDPGSEYAAVIPKFICAALENRRPVIYGDGSQSRDFTFIDNVVDANIRAMNSEITSGVMNIATGSRTTLVRLVEILSSIFDRPIEPVFEPERAGDVKHSYASIERAKERIGYAPLVEFETGVRRTVDFFRLRAGGDC